MIELCTDIIYPKLKTGKRGLHCIVVPSKKKKKKRRRKGSIGRGGRKRREEEEEKEELYKQDRIIAF